MEDSFTTTVGSSTSPMARMRPTYGQVARRGVVALFAPESLSFLNNSINYTKANLNINVSY